MEVVREGNERTYTTPQGGEGRGRVRERGGA